MRQSVQSLLVATAVAALLTACGGGGLAPLTPGIGTLPQSTPTPTPSPKPSAGPSIGSKPTFSGGGSGDCTTGITFDAVGESAAIAISEAGYTGSWTINNTTPSVATASISGSTLTITSVSAGQTYFTVSDSFGNSSACNVGVTTTGGTIQ